MELTPETFEKAEFIERRRGGYDIDQVETFLEETGTEFARMLVRFQRTEAELDTARSDLDAARSDVDALERQVSDLRQKLALTTDRLLDTEQRLEEEIAGRAARPVASADPTGAGGEQGSEEDVANVAKALILAQEASDKALREAKAEARAIVEGANARSERQLAETTTKVTALINEARSRADREYASRKEAVHGEVAELEDRREVLAESISRMEARINGYREDLRRAGEELIAVAEDPSFLGDEGGDDVGAAEEVDQEPDGSIPADDRGTTTVGDAEADGSDPSGSDVADEDGDDVDGAADDEQVTESVSEDDLAPVDEDVVTPVDEEDEVDEAPEESPVQDSLDFEDDIDDEVGTDQDTDATTKDTGSTDPMESGRSSKGWFDADGEKPQRSVSTEVGRQDPDVGGRLKASDAEPMVDGSDDDEESDDMLDLRSGSDRSPKPRGSGDGDGEWGPGSWSRIEETVLVDMDLTAGSDSEKGDRSDESDEGGSVRTTRVQSSHRRTDADQPTEAVDRVELIRDRYLEELDQAVNTELDAEDEALAAFLEGSGNSKARRFGWRR